MLSRARQHRWLWALALLAMAFKVMAATVCMNDAAPNQHGSAAMATLAPSTSILAASHDSGCVLGEGSACHCACAETLPVPVKLVLTLAPVGSSFLWLAPAYRFAPARPAALLRPPIA